jgi:hypothetical protein
VTGPYDWATDPGAFPPQAAPAPPRPVGQLFRPRCWVPAVWVRYSPSQGQLVRVDRRHGAVQVQWRKPRRQDFFPRN